MSSATGIGKEVARHYDALDPLYRRIWGDHVHHGLWKTGQESAQEAMKGMSRFVAEQAEIGSEDRVCDVGCGYGATAKLLASEQGALVTGVTISRKQFERAVESGNENPTFKLADWLENDFDDSSFDAVIAMESTEHLPDLSRGVSEMGRVLRRGGRLVICAWLTAPDLEPWEIKHLFKPIQKHGHLVGMTREDTYHALIQHAGLRLISSVDLSKNVARTWPTCILRTFSGLFRDREIRRFLFSQPIRNLSFGLTLLRIWLAYSTGAMRYVSFKAVKP